MSFVLELGFESGEGKFNTRLGNNFYFNNFISGKSEPDIDGAADNFILNQPGNSNHIAPPTIEIP